MRFALRARSVLTLAGESPARGLSALNAPVRQLTDGVVIVRNTDIEAVEPYPSFARRKDAPPLLDLGNVSLAPGFINCHCHLELSHLEDKTVSGRGFVPWLASLVARTRRPPAHDEARASLISAVRQLRAGHTVHVGDVGSRVPMAVAAALADNNPAPAREKAARESLPFNLPDCPSSPALPPTCSALTATHFLEAFGFGPPLSCQTSPLSAGGYAPAAAASLPPHLHSSCAVVAHSLYSTCPEALRATRAWCRDNGRPFSFHLAECLEETLFLREGRGELHRFFAYRVLPGNWQAPGLDPTPFAERLGLLGPDTLAVHCTQCDAKDIDILGKNRVSCCLCPRSNARIGTGIAPARHMAKAGILLCLGTDGLSSAPDLDMGGEMRAVRDTWGFSPQAILRMATLNGAHALGLSRMLGSLEPGKRAALSFVKDM